MEKIPDFHSKIEAGKMRTPTFGPISLDLKTKEVTNTLSGHTEYLTDTEYQVLWLLVRAQGNLIEYSDIVTFLYGDNESKDIPLSNGYEVFVSRLRSKLEYVAGNALEIENVYGLGYRLKLKGAASQDDTSSAAA